MSYLSQPTSKTEYGVVQVGNNIDVLDGIISIPQNVSTTATVTFSTASISNLFVKGEPVVTDVIPGAGAGIAISNVVNTGNTASFTVTNIGVLSLSAGTGISITTSTGNITISSFGADLLNVYGTTTNYTATLTDEYIGVFSAAAVTITLPIGVAGRVYWIKDEFGQGSGKITIQPQNGELIDGKPNYIISVPYQCCALVYRAGQWRLI